MTAQIIPVQPFDLVVFGGTGDLSLRKLLPALYHRDADGQLPEDARVIAVSRQTLDDAQYRARVTEALGKFIPKAEWREDVGARFLARLHHVRLDVTGSDGWKELRGLLRESHVRVFYPATAPDLFGDSASRVGEEKLITPATRLVLEKPIGKDLKRARAINDLVGRVCPETQICRIDQYLGKETVQNLMALRFANSLFEPVWNHSNIDHV